MFLVFYYFFFSITFWIHRAFRIYIIHRPFKYYDWYLINYSILNIQIFSYFFMNSTVLVLINYLLFVKMGRLLYKISNHYKLIKRKYIKIKEGRKLEKKINFCIKKLRRRREYVRGHYIQDVHALNFHIF